MLYEIFLIYFFNLIGFTGKIFMAWRALGPCVRFFIDASLSPDLDWWKIGRLFEFKIETNPQNHIILVVQPYLLSNNYCYSIHSLFLKKLFPNCSRHVILWKCIIIIAYYLKLFAWGVSACDQFSIQPSVFYVNPIHLHKVASRGHIYVEWRTMIERHKWYNPQNQTILGASIHMCT